MTEREDTTMTATLEPLTTDRADRRRMPRRRHGYTTSVTITGADFYLTANPNDDGTLGEIFIKFGKQGSTLGGLFDAVGISVSIGLQSGVPLETFVSKYINMRFEPFGMTDDRDLTTVTSVLDYVFRRLALDFLDDATRARL
ncbi:MAG: vitamin B12-dependent ribonucleotide reductase, partial [Pseudonocardiaceae bacterium]